MFQGNGGKDLIVLTSLIVYYVEYHLILIIFFIDVNDNVRLMIIEWNKVSKLKLGSNDLIFYCFYEVAAIWAAKR